MARAARGAGIAGVGLLAALAGLVHAEIVPVASPLVLAPGPAATAPADSGPGAEIVPATEASAEIVPPQPSARETTRAVQPVAGEEAGEPTADHGRGSGQAVVGSGSAVELPTAPQPSANIRWPSVATPVGTVGVEAEGASAAPAPAVDAGETGAPAATPTGDAAEITDIPEDAFDRALAAWRNEAGPRSQGEAARWFRVAADAGDRRAAVAFAYLQGLGLGVKRDPIAARRTLQQASEAGVPRADYLLSLLAAADRRPGSERQQGELRERAARRDDPAAQNAMGVHYQLQGDRATAEMWYRRAADNGSPAARFNLAGLDQHDEPDRLSDTPDTVGADEAESLFEQARRHHRGDGVPVDYGQALRLYRLAAARGSEPAQQMLGLIQSRTLPDGGFDPTWMRQLATAAVGKPGSANLVPGAASAAQPQLDDPLLDLAELGR